jgi:uncharacterized OsmC-like protein
VLVLKRIHVKLHIKAPEAARATVERAHGLTPDGCPVHRSLRAAIAITTELLLHPEAEPAP